ncbi:MAG: JAB domain-containing protein [Chloroflexi bacterium]|nr:MAG: JAB domain-containing protein [Chloroflexota bacterium]
MPEIDVATYQPLIHDLPANERPRERLQYYGARSLSNAELLAIILRAGVEGRSAVGLGQQLLAHFGGLRGLAQATIDDICRLRGIGPAKAVQIKAALELGRRLAIEAPEERPQITSPADAANLVMLDMSLLEHEELWVLLLDTKNHVLDIVRLYQGSVNTSLIRVAEVFREAIKRNCAAIIVAHNHPSGDPTPSPEDVRITRQIHQAGKLLETELLDHLIIGHSRFVSLKERGLGFDV